jgi:hypothetical protein
MLGAILVVASCKHAQPQRHTQGRPFAPVAEQVGVVDSKPVTLTKVLAPRKASWQACIARIRQEHQKPTGKVLDIRIPDTTYAIVTIDGKITPFMLYWEKGGFQLWKLDGMGKHYENATIVMPKSQVLDIHGETPGEKDRSASWTLDFSDSEGLQVRFLPDIEIY